MSERDKKFSATDSTPADRHWRMDGYYYGFEPTGLAIVDLILSAVGCAGKSFHHTDCWNDDTGSPYHDDLRGNSPVEWINNAAIEAAKAIRELEAERDALRADAARYRHMRSSFARDIKHRLTWYLPAMTPMTADGLDSAIDAAIAAKELRDDRVLRRALNIGGVQRSNDRCADQVRQAADQNGRGIGSSESAPTNPPVGPADAAEDFREA